MKRQSLSIVVLTKNEESNIEELMDNVNWAKEIIVIDDNSTDNTLAIAKHYTDRIIVHALDGNFAQQRNVGMDEAKCDWILQMDADERITVGLKNAIIDILSNSVEFDAYRFKRLNNFCGKFLEHGGEGLHKPLRLFRNGKARFCGSNIHEQVQVDGKIGEIDEVMEHYNFPTIQHYVETQNFYTGLEAEKLFLEKGRMPLRKLKRELTVSPLKLFFKLYFQRKGYKDGIYGFIFILLSVWRRFLIYAKYWELSKEKYNKDMK